MFDCAVFSFLCCLPQCAYVLCVSEINRVRKDMYSDTVNGLVERHPMELPEPLGPIVHQQEKLFVPVKEYPDVSRCCTHITIYCCRMQVSVIALHFSCCFRTYEADQIHLILCQY